MTSLTGGFAPIAGAGASKDKGGAKKNDLTSGLISLGSNSGASARTKNDDLDFSDFDVDDLLLDDAGGGSKKKSKDKSKSKSPTASPTKKKSSGSSSKKKKDKEKKKQSGGSLDFLNDDEDDKDDDWDKHDEDFGSSTKKSGKAFDLDELLVPAKKKNTKLDDEFARMLGLEDDFADRNTTMSSVAIEEGDVSEFGDSPAKRGAYAPTMSRNETVPVMAEDSTPPPVDDVGTGGGPGGLDASFFDEPATSSSKNTSGDDDILSFLSSTSSSDRRGGRGAGGRRGAGTTVSGGDDRGGKSLFADPFDKNESASGRRAGGLDDFFSSSSSRGATKPVKANPLEESLSATTKAPPGKSTFASLFGSADNSKTMEGKEEGAEVKPIPRSLSLKPAASTANAKDDLLAELFPTETLRAPTRKAPSPVKDETEQHDDLLAELFPVEGKKPSFPKDPEPLESPSPPRGASKPSPEYKGPSPSQPAPEKVADAKKLDASMKPSTAAVRDFDSARDSLLKDLLPDSPPRQHRTSTRFTDTNDNPAPTDPEKTANESASVTPAASGKNTQPAEAPPPPKPSPAKVLVVEEPTTSKMSQPSPVKPQLTPAIQESPLPSPGKAKTLTLGTPSKLREVEFEQSKDDLLEEILSSAPSSPLQRSPDVANGNLNGPVSPRSRRSSYSLSFDHDAVLANEPLESPPPTGVTVRRRASRSPEKQDMLSQPSTSAATTVTQTVFLRDINAEEELKKLHAITVAELETHHAEALARATAETQQIESRLLQEQATATAQASACEVHKLQLQQLRDELSEAHTAYGSLMSEMQSLQTQHTLQKTECDLFGREKAALLRQLSLAEEQQRTLVAQLAQEKLSHQQTQLAFADFKRETEQTAQLRTEKERAQMDRLYHQLQNSLAQLTVLQEQGSDDAAAKRDLEAATRMRMINSLETTSRGYAQQTQDECHRLTSLMSSLETTLRAFRQEHLEEKERLRQEQMRLNVLAQHFQAQTSVLNEKSDANAQLLAQHLGASLQDTRAAEARLAVRRQQLAEDEQKLYNERAVFASHREAWLEQRQRETAELEAQRSAIEREWRALQRERDDLEDVIASHEDAFRALQQQQLQLEAEKDRVAVGALHVAEMAQKFELLTKQLVDKEHAMQQQRAETEELRRQWATREQSVASERRKLDEREVRLHAQLKQMEASRRKMNDERRQQLQQLHVQQRQRAEPAPHHHSSATSAVPTATSADTAATVGGVRAHVMLGGGHNASPRASYSSPPHFMMQFTTPPPQQSQQQQQQQFAMASPWDAAKVQQSPALLDPSGFSPAFRQLVEENWSKQPRHTEAALHKERMAIHCLGLDTRRDRDDAVTTKPQQRHGQTASSILPTKASATIHAVATTGAAASHTTTRPPPPPSTASSPPSTSSLGGPRVLSVHL